jgi:hypothetical protein
MARIVLTALGVVHLVGTVWHGAAHTELAIGLSAAQNAFVYVVILFAPLVAIGLLWTRHFTLGCWLFLASMGGSLLFGVYYHYVFVSPDNIHHLPPGSAAAHSRFTLSAAVIALLELTSTLSAAFVLGLQMRQADEW